MTHKLRTFAANFKSAGLAISAAAVVGLLAGCATSNTQTAANTEPGVFKFTVYHLTEPVKVNNWSYDPAKSEGPEGAALNITTLMQNGDVDQWLANWNDAEKPTVTDETRAALQQSWQSLKDGQVFVVNRIIADANMVVEISVVTTDKKSEKIQIPLTRCHGLWKLTNLDSKSEFLNWEASDNKIISECEPKTYSDYLNALAKARPQAKL